MNTTPKQPGADIRQDRYAKNIARRLLIALCVIYAAHAFYAIVTSRALYGDAAWYLVRIASEGHVTNFYTNFEQEFYYSRFVAFTLIQWPAVVAAHIGVDKISLLSLLLSIAYYSHKLLSLLLCYALLPSERKVFIVFPCLAVFAGSINSEVYIVTETHLAASVFWPLLIAVTSSKDMQWWRFLCYAVALFLNCFIYESMAILGVALLIVMMVNAAGAPVSQRRYWLILSTMAALAIAMNWWAILVPRDPFNRAAFTSAVLKTLHDTASGVARAHIGPLVSSIAITAVAILLLKASALNVAERAMLVVLTLALALGPTLHFLKYAPTLDLSDSIGDRSVGGFLLQIVLVVMYLLTIKFFRGQLSARIGSIAVVIAALAVGQISWQMLATNSWSNALSVASAKLSHDEGAVPCDATTLKGNTWYQIPPASILCHWWITPLSIILAPGGDVGSLFTSTELFKPFDMFDFTSLPAMRFARVDYRRYQSATNARKTIHLGQVIPFSTDSPGSNLMENGFSFPENWGTWTDGKDATLGFCITDPIGEDGLAVQFTLTPFVSPARPSLDVAIAANKHTEMSWHFSQRGEVTRTVNIPASHLIDSGCTKLQLSFSDSRSGSEIGAPNDPRHLGVAVINMVVKKY